MVGRTGLEPAQVLPHNDLNVARIPIPPPAQLSINYTKSCKIFYEADFCRYKNNFRISEQLKYISETPKTTPK